MKTSGSSPRALVGWRWSLVSKSVSWVQARRWQEEGFSGFEGFFKDFERIFNNFWQRPRDFQGFPRGFQGFPRGFQGFPAIFQWVSKQFRRFQGISKGFPGVSMDFEASRKMCRKTFLEPMLTRIQNISCCNVKRIFLICLRKWHEQKHSFLLKSLSTLRWEERYCSSLKDVKVCLVFSRVF